MRATANPAYLELIEFLAGGTTPETLIAFRPSQAVQERVSNLIDREDEGQLTEDDKQELEDYLQLEHLMILAKSPGAPETAAWLLKSTRGSAEPRSTSTARE